MNKKEKIDWEITKTLDLLDQKETIPINPYFYTRVRAKLEERHKKRKNYFTFLQPAFFVLLFAVNLTTVFWYFNSSETYNITPTRKALIEIISDDLTPNLNQSDILFLE
ncbi:MAG: hypothetical protein CVV23_05525 [Ignavibacteriae bacterium HGW-Ignavibacteriae-2]|jgi:hypothetical protein|nr:MAG: hypothetical protein CVV23_05525 [Ignavibacteriae bacterium HGW-Ignavibacteriae-2]